MNRENLQEGETEEKKLAENLEFMRLAIERTRRDFDPGAVGWIAWGMACLIGYVAMHFLATPTNYKLMWLIWILLLAIAGGVNAFCDIRIRKQEKKAGMVPLLSRQVGWVWAVAVLHGVVWSILGLFRDWHGGPGFLWALVYSIALCATGIIYAREWLWAGLGVFVGMIAAFFVKDYAYIILGLAMGLGCIIPAIIAHKKYRRQKRENAQA